MLPLIDHAYVQFALLAAATGVLVYIAGAGFRFWRTNLARQRNLVDQVNALLPQTQCGQCGFDGCLPYARAMVNGTPINQCPPGGNTTIVRLAGLLNDAPRPLNPEHGVLTETRVAFIREAECIGCTKCIKACPVDAIVGGPKLMHTVITSECTGCDLCVAPCPVDCIDMLPVPTPSQWQWPLPTQVRPRDFPLAKLHGGATALATDRR